MLSLIFGLSDLTLSEDFNVRGYTSWVFVTRELISAEKSDWSSCDWFKFWIWWRRLNDPRFLLTSFEYSTDEVRSLYNNKKAVSLSMINMYLETTAFVNPSFLPLFLQFTIYRRNSTLLI